MMNIKFREYKQGGLATDGDRYKYDLQFSYPEPGSGIRCLFDPWIREPVLWNCNYFLWFRFQLLKSYGSVRLRLLKGYDAGSSSNWWKDTVPVPAQFSDHNKKLSKKNSFLYQTLPFWCKLKQFCWSNTHFILCLWEHFWLLNYDSGSGLTKLWFRFRFGQKVAVSVLVLVPQHCQEQNRFCPDPGYDRYFLEPEDNFFGLRILKFCVNLLQNFLVP